MLVFIFSVKQESTRTFGIVIFWVIIKVRNNIIVFTRFNVYIVNINKHYNYHCLKQKGAEHSQFLIVTLVLANSGAALRREDELKA